MEDRTLTITTDSGEEILCEILFTTHSNEFNKDYVVFVEKGTENASAAIYFPSEAGEGKLEQIQSEEEWKMLEELLDEYATRQENAECSGSCESCDENCDSQSEDDLIEE